MLPPSRRDMEVELGQSKKSVAFTGRPIKVSF